MQSFSDKSKHELMTCHPDLQRLFNEVIKVTDCTVIQGYRGEAEQTEAYMSGNSKTRYPLSRHNTTPSEAIDVMPYYSARPHIRWDTTDQRVAGDLREFVGIVKGIAHSLGIVVEWGGDFKTFFDGPHWQLKK